jgi:hypothetical protein
MPDVTITSAAAFIPEIWANQALLELRANMVLSQLVTRDTDVASFVRGDILHIPVPGTFVANDKAPNMAVQLQTPSDGEVTVTLNKHKEASVLIEDIAKAQSSQDLMSRYVRHMVRPIAEAIEKDLFSLYANLTTTGGVGATDLTGTSIRAARKLLNDNKVPLEGRSFVISTKDEISLLGDTTLQSFFAFSQPEAVQEGKIGRVYGFDIYVSQLAPFSTNQKNLAFTPEFAILAMRGLPMNEAPNVQQLTIQDPVSGLVLRQTVSYSPNFLGVQVTIDVLYGFSLLRNLAGVLMIS